MKQRAVEWLISELRESKDFHRVINELNQRSSIVRHILNEAIEMEKQQIIDAYKEGCFGNILDESTDKIRGEQYYNEIYKSE